MAAVCVAGAAILLAAGCGPKATSQPAEETSPQPARAKPPEPKPPDENTDSSKLPGRVHVVQPGETLFSLSERYYSTGKQWRKIYVANRNRLPDPNDLPVGMRLIIPP